MNWNNYDEYKLATPYDNEPDYDIYKAEKYDFFTMDYDAVIEFDTKVLAASQFRSDEDLEEFAEELAEELGLLNSEEAVVLREED